MITEALSATKVSTKTGGWHARTLTMLLTNNFSNFADPRVHIRGESSPTVWRNKDSFFDRLRGSSLQPFLLVYGPVAP